MGRELCARWPRARQVFAAADDALGFALSRLCFDGPLETLTLTENTQPALLTVSCALATVLGDDFGVRPQWAAGHSLGEFGALVAAGALRFGDALLLVRERGLAMQRAVAPGAGAMAAIFGLDLDTIESICAAASQGEVVSAANLNGAGQIVIAGHAGAIERAIDAARERGAKRAVPLNVSAPFHCALMAPAADRLDHLLRQVEIGSLRCPVIANVDAQPNSDPQRVPALLVRQVCSPVRWEQSMHSLRDLGCELAVEAGPGKVLAGLLKRTAPEIQCLAGEDLEAIAQAVAS